ncbi:MAG: PaaI family thioesterase [Syntrophobacterales bacterium]|nr:PaaI family thioesterase [Syntrophobacterales bacterium]
MKAKSIQERYPDEFAHCYGCGRLNRKGLHIKSYPEDDECVCRYTPEPYHTGGVPGYAYGGFIASLIDCHSSATASAAKLRLSGPSAGNMAPPRFVAASLKVDFFKPTPVDKVLELRGKVKEMKGRKVIVVVTLSADGKVCARGESVLIEMPPVSGDTARLSGPEI